MLPKSYVAFSAKLIVSPAVVFAIIDSISETLASAGMSWLAAKTSSASLLASTTAISSTGAATTSSAAISSADTAEIETTAMKIINKANILLLNFIFFSPVNFKIILITNNVGLYQIPISNY